MFVCSVKVFAQYPKLIIQFTDKNNSPIPACIKRLPKAIIAIPLRIPFKSEAINHTPANTNVVFMYLFIIKKYFVFQSECTKKII